MHLKDYSKGWWIPTSLATTGQGGPRIMEICMSITNTLHQPGNFLSRKIRDRENYKNSKKWIEIGY